MTDGDWIKSPTARRVIACWADPRPAWLWNGDGSRLVWRNRAAELFGGRLKKGELKLLPLAKPISGQVARLIRLGTAGRSSLSRLQFLAGERPISATCAVTPLPLPDGQPGLLILGVDPVDDEIFAVPPRNDDASLGELLPAGSDYALFDRDGALVASSPAASQLTGAGTGDTIVIGDTIFAIDRFEAAPQGKVTLLLLTPKGQAEAPPEPPPETPAVEAEAQAEAPEAEASAEEPAAIDEPVAEETPAVDEPVAETPVEPEIPALPSEPEGDRRLTALFDQLAENEALYAPLDAGDDVPLTDHVPEAEDTAQAEITAEAQPPATETGPHDEPPAETAGAPEATPLAEDDGSRRMLYRLVGRGYRPLETDSAEPAAEAAEPEAIEPPPPDMESVERVSRYNFDELSRILNDRVSGEAAPQSVPTSIEAIIESTPTPAAQPQVPAAPGGALINLGGETLVLNRLPLGILVFRDQQVLFANRAITEMIGYESVEQLRHAGLASLFPAASDEVPEAGPINHLVQRDGTLVPVTARLQSVSWQGKPALMLSASTTEVRTGHEGAVRAFAEILAEAREDGFIDVSRNGIVSAASANARVLLRQSEHNILGKRLVALVDAADQEALRVFLERPARFAETARPVLTVRGAAPGTDIMLFAQGQAGIITGYFGMVHQREMAPALPAPKGRPADLDNGLLGRLSRGIRRPLNTIIGFSDLIGSQAFGALDNPRYVDYAEDIKTAGQEIAALVDELEDYARLRDGRYAPRPSDVDLVTLLDSCVLRVRGQAGAARVLVRSAVSEALPRIRADRASLGQAVLNLLASAIDQTPAGGSVVLSAQNEDDDSISVHVRDSAAHEADSSERFVVFRDGVGRNGEKLGPVRSSVGLALTRALLSVNAFTLSVDPAGSVGTLFTMAIPPEAVTREALPPPVEEDGSA